MRGIIRVALVAGMAALAQASYAGDIDTATRSTAAAQKARRP